MIRRVYKYQIPFMDKFTLSLPEGAQVLSFQMQGNTPFIWVMIDPMERSMVIRNFRLAGTGHPIDCPVKFIGTVQMDSGSLVFHLFEVVEG